MFRLFFPLLFLVVISSEFFCVSQTHFPILRHSVSASKNICMCSRSARHEFEICQPFTESRAPVALNCERAVPKRRANSRRSSRAKLDRSPTNWGGEREGETSLHRGPCTSCAPYLKALADAKNVFAFFFVALLVIGRTQQMFPGPEMTIT